MSVLALLALAAGQADEVVGPELIQLSALTGENAHLGNAPLYTTTVNWAANKRFEILKFKLKFPIARTFELSNFLGLVLGCIEAKFCK